LLTVLEVNPWLAGLVALGLWEAHNGEYRVGKISHPWLESRREKEGRTRVPLSPSRIHF
jgi:hypothetical protein